jgi:hypothetical protein
METTPVNSSCKGNESIVDSECMKAESSECLWIVRGECEFDWLRL